MPPDGSTMGEVIMRGNSVMAGYLDDPETTAEACRDGWFHSGDAAVMHPDGYIEVRDRFKDVIISGGENISTIEVEQALVRHPAVLEAAVVGDPARPLGRAAQGVRRRCARRRGHARGADRVLPRADRALQVPRRRRVPRACRRTSTGKVQKYVLREAEWAGRERASTDASRRTGRAWMSRMRRTFAARLLLAGLVLAGAGGAGTGDEVRGVIQKVEKLRGLRTARPIAVSTLDAAALRGVVLRLLEREREPQSDAGWDDALHLLGVLRPGQSLEQVQRRALAGQVAGLYVPRSRRLYVLGSGGSAPRAVVAHEVVHALQDEHFRLTRGPFAPRPRDHDGELAAQALVEGDATEVQSRYVAALSPIDLDRRAGAHAARRCPAAAADGTARSSSASWCSPTRRDRSSSAPCVRAAGSDCSTAHSATLRGRPLRCSTRLATWPAIRRRRPSACPPGATASRPRSGPRTWWR